MQTVYRWWAWLVFAAVVVQVGFAGYGAFFVAGKSDDNPVTEDQFEDGFGPHIGLGYLIVLLVLVYLLLAFAARVGRPRLKRNGILFGLLILQVLLAWFGYEAAAVGFFHPINALLIFGLSGSMAWDSWRARSAAPAETIAEPT